MSGCRGEIEADDEIPRIFIRCLSDDIPELVQYIEHGIEEEGVSWVVQHGYDGDGVAVAHEASYDSSLKIGVSVHDSRVVIHHKQLPSDDPLFDIDQTSPETARKLGSNSARLAKKTPLKPIG
ncbi:glycerol dehydratase reactivase beta/small subunit family protein [Halorubrum lipolyticum]|uniref:Glycerol dehydratase reactivation factor, small subunit n=1 Tax=Halorubrum lipolyticum DSM 21995 TaxID=1227482 RepID=M0NP90_9EURY|nr:glycerol dehydratase reactivase beta/small subunit family protein [Halorubrum lipolyticum]EMA59576.1 glycerol dehydratase reactivation factor, small subunit [Halorubrum lipolyticum DSM 21995]